MKKNRLFAVIAIALLAGVSIGAYSQTTGMK